MRLTQDRKVPKVQHTATVGYQALDLCGDKARLDDRSTERFEAHWGRFGMRGVQALLYPLSVLGNNGMGS